ncbi:MAG: lycopene cyclase domain-containing protein [Armatimonadota bacterium]|nr:lycopene cyclase domain-containing protein [Armatimonadota bacterium]MDW8155693.1 lycopene cyclase domain-containing protein [Armatimonadota bacterium]
MTYLQFHLTFTVPAWLAALLWARPRGGEVGPYLALPLVALVYTTPWDNWMVRLGVWGYAADRVVGTLGWVPVEEYLFFLLQPLLTGALAVRWARSPAVPGPVWARVVGGAMGMCLSASGVLMVAAGGRTLYLGLLLGYFGPVLAFQWAVGGEVLWARRRTLGASVAVPTVYLSAADLWAVTREGIWWISQETTVGARVAGLPVEEVLFFAVTNLAVVQGLLLALDPAWRRRR